MCLRYAEMLIAPYGNVLGKNNIRYIKKNSMYKKREENTNTHTQNNVQMTMVLAFQTAAVQTDHGSEGSKEPSDHSLQASVVLLVAADIPGGKWTFVPCQGLFNSFIDISLPNNGILYGKLLLVQGKTGISCIV